MGLQDWQIGALTGIAFAVIYCFASIPVARLADRTNRTYLLSGALAIWSAFTALCGLAGNFLQLALCRFGVGAAESACTPASHSLIGDYTAQTKRGLAMAIYQTGAPIGAMLGMVFGALIADAYGWRAAFLIAGLPGLIIACLAFFTLPEPRRQLPPAPRPAANIVRDMKVLLGRKAFRLFAIGGGLITLRAYGTQAFVASFFFRVHADGLDRLAEQIHAQFGITIGPIGIVGVFLGVVGGAVSMLGTLFGGYMTDYWTKRDARHFATVAAIPQFIQVPFFILGLIWPDIIGALLLMSVPVIFNSMSHGPFWTGIQALATPATRATASAAALLSTTVIGLGLGPLIVGILSDLLAQSGMTVANGLRWALIVAETPAILAGIFLLMSRPYLKSETWLDDNPIAQGREETSS